MINWVGMVVRLATISRAGMLVGSAFRLACWLVLQLSVGQACWLVQRTQGIGEALGAAAGQLPGYPARLPLATHCRLCVHPNHDCRASPQTVAIEEEPSATQACDMATSQISDLKLPEECGVPATWLPQLSKLRCFYGTAFRFSMCGRPLSQTACQEVVARQQRKDPALALTTRHKQHGGCEFIQCVTGGLLQA